MSFAAFILKLEADAKGVERGVNVAQTHFKRLGETVKAIEKRKDEQIKKDKELQRLAFERLKPEEQLNSLLRTREQIANRIARVEDPRLKNTYLQKQLEIEQRISAAKLAGIGGKVPPLLGAPPILAGAGSAAAIGVGAAGMGGVAKRLLGRFAGLAGVSAFGRFGMSALTDPMEATQLGRAVGIDSGMSQRLSLASKAIGVEPSSTFERVGELKKGGLSTKEALSQLDPKLIRLANSFSELAISSNAAVSGLERMLLIMRYFGAYAKALTFAAPNWFNRRVSNQFRTVDAPSEEEMQMRLDEAITRRDEMAVAEGRDWFRRWKNGEFNDSPKATSKARLRGAGPSSAIDTDELARIGLFRGAAALHTPITERLDRIHRQLQELTQEVREE